MKDLKVLEVDVANAPRNHKLAVYEEWIADLKESLENVVRDFHPSRGEVRLAKEILGEKQE